jgi:hypothetical protein
MENELHLYLNLPKMAQLTNPIWPVKVVLHLHLKSIGAHSKLAQRNTKGMRPVTADVGRPDNESVS